MNRGVARLAPAWLSASECIHGPDPCGLRVRSLPSRKFGLIIIPGMVDIVSGNWGLGSANSTWNVVASITRASTKPAQAPAFGFPSKELW